MVSPQDLAALKQLNVDTLLKLRDVLVRLGQQSYTHFNIKGRASVGQHVRHTLEFYQCLFEANGVVNYDKRRRDILIESSPDHAVAILNGLITIIEEVESGSPLQLHAEMPSVAEQPLVVGSSLSRELLYVLEHSIHHMALIRILIMDQDPDFELDDSFGVAYSTLAYRVQEANC
jgi:hypothetical protein